MLNHPLSSKNFSECNSEIHKAIESLNCSLSPITERIRSLFYLRNIETPYCAEAIGNCLLKEKDSVLLRHECAYVLGQMIQPSTVNILIDVLRNTSNDEITRHECAEALGNFPPNSEIYEVFDEILKKKNESRPVRESIIIAQCKLKEASILLNSGKSKFDSFDPAFPLQDCISFDTVKSIFLNKKLSLYERYKAMFTLRDINTKESINILIEGFRSEESELFKHEVAFIFGQMCSPHTVEVLSEVLRCEDEHPMVRHEAAEALGSIGNEEALKVLETFKDSPHRVIRESVETGLDITRI